MGELRYGTSSWSEKSWVGPFYPKGTAPGEMLSVYARRFDTVEADVTYYRTPGERMVRGWERKTPDGFQLAAKFPRSIVHAGEKAQPDHQKVLVLDQVWDEARRFIEAMSLLGDKCGPLVLQFPYFNKKAFPDRDEFLDRLASFLCRLPDGFRYGVEIRNRHWIDSTLTQLLRENSVALVLTDLVYMPHPADLAERLDPVTADFVYGRLIGDRKAVEKRTRTFDRIVIDQGPRLDRWATLTRNLLDRVPFVYLYANNHYAGHGPATITDLAARVLGPDAVDPPAPPAGPEQQSLFGEL